MSKSSLPNHSIEFHDSVLSTIMQKNAQLRILLKPAMLHKSSGIPGVDPGEVWASAVEIVLEGVGASVDVIAGEPLIYDGYLMVDKKKYFMLEVSPPRRITMGTLKLSLEHPKIPNLELQFTSLQAVLIDSGRFIDKFN